MVTSALGGRRASSPLLFLSALADLLAQLSAIEPRGPSPADVPGPPHVAPIRLDRARFRAHTPSLHDLRARPHRRVRARGSGVPWSLAAAANASSHAEPPSAGTEGSPPWLRVLRGTGAVAAHALPQSSRAGRSSMQRTALSQCRTLSGSRRQLHRATLTLHVSHVSSQAGQRAPLTRSRLARRSGESLSHPWYGPSRQSRRSPLSAFRRHRLAVTSLRSPASLGSIGTASRCRPSLRSPHLYRFLFGSIAPCLPPDAAGRSIGGRCISRRPAACQGRRSRSRYPTPLRSPAPRRTAPRPRLSFRQRRPRHAPFGQHRRGLSLPRLTRVTRRLE